MKKISIFEKEIDYSKYQESTVGAVKKGDPFKLKPTESAPVWIRGEYVSIEGAKRYSCTKWDDANHEKLMKKDQVVYVNFDF